MSGTTVRAWAPGRVNLIGDHTDYTGGWCMPMAIDLGTTVQFTQDPSSDEIVLTTDTGEGDARLFVGDESAPEPRGWARYVAAVAAEVPSPPRGGSGRVASDLPIGAGLSSSASLEVALALAFGAPAGRDLAGLCRRAEHRASGVPCGIMDQLSIVCGVAGHALLMDCAAETVDAVPIPEGTEVIVVHSGVERALENVAYGERRAECTAAEAQIGPLRSCSPIDAESLADPTLRRRARHVVSENGRVIALAGALRTGDLAGCGRLMRESHDSLASDFDVSLPALDALVDLLCDTDGVFGARMTGAGFGGCVVALARSGTFASLQVDTPSWLVMPSDGAKLLGLR